MRGMYYISRLRGNKITWSKWRAVTKNALLSSRIRILTLPQSRLRERSERHGLDKAFMQHLGTLAHFFLYH